MSKKGQRPVRRFEGFKLLQLPMLARNEVIRSMDIKERISLSVCSRRMEGMIRCTKGKVDKIEFHVNNINSALKIESLQSYLYHCSPYQLAEGSYNIDRKILSGWIDNNSSSFQNCLSIFKHLQNILSFKSFCLHVYLRGMTAEFFKEILTEPGLKDFESLRLENGEIDAECLDLVMETAQSNRVLHIKGTDIPIDYYHKNAFKFHDIHYHDARWVRIEHLLTLKDSYSVNLVRDHLIHSDVNTFIKYWIDSDHDMVQILSFKAIVSFQTERFFDGIVVLKGRRQATYLVAANPTKQRKRPILSITCYDGIFRLKSWNKDEKFQLWGNLIVSWASEYKVLMLLNEKKDLEGKLREIQKLLDTSQDQNMVKKKNEIAGELLNVSQEVASLNLVLRDGVYSY